MAEATLGRLPIVAGEGNLDYVTTNTVVATDARDGQSDQLRQLW